MTETKEEGSSSGLGDEHTMDAHALLQAINGASCSKDRVIKRQRRGNRMKVYDNGYIFTFDKDSQCGQRSFWRCERKSECQARVHTNPATNQILKRINEHTHGPPNREELPPWLILSQVQSDTSDDGMQQRRDSTTGILINANYSTCANTHLARIVERELEKTEDALASEVEGFLASTRSRFQIFTTVKEEPPEEPPTPVSPPKKKKKKHPKRDERDDSLFQPEDFEDLVEITKKILQLVKNNRSWQDALPQSLCPSDVTEFLETNNLLEYSPRLTKYSMDKLRLLSQADCITLLNSEPDGILLFYALKTKPKYEEASSSSSSPLTIFVAPESSDDEPLYQMITIQERTPAELRSEMEQRGLLCKEQGHVLCVEGPNKIKVALNEKIISSWPSDGVFQFSLKNVCLLKKIS